MEPRQPPAPAPVPPPPGYSPPPGPGGYTPSPPAWRAPEPEVGPAPGVRFASPGARLMAYIVDVIILGVAFLALTLVFGFMMAGAAAADSSGAAIGGGLLYVVVLVGISLAYFPWFWWKGGATPGMKMFRLRVVRDSDGGPISGSAATLRLLGYWVNQVVFYIGFIWIFVDKRRRGWHDLIAGTVVIES